MKILLQLIKPGTSIMWKSREVTACCAGKGLAGAGRAEAPLDRASSSSCATATSAIAHHINTAYLQRANQRADWATYLRLGLHKAQLAKDIPLAPANEVVNDSGLLEQLVAIVQRSPWDDVIVEGKGLSMLPTLLLALQVQKIASELQRKPSWLSQQLFRQLRARKGGSRS